MCVTVCASMCVDVDVCACMYRWVGPGAWGDGYVVECLCLSSRECVCL